MLRLRFDSHCSPVKFSQSDERSALYTGTVHRAVQLLARYSDSAPLQIQQASGRPQHRQLLPASRLLDHSRAQDSHISSRSASRRILSTCVGARNYRPDPWGGTLEGSWSTTNAFKTIPNIMMELRARAIVPRMSPVLFCSLIAGP